MAARTLPLEQLEQLRQQASCRCRGPWPSGRDRCRFRRSSDKRAGPGTASCWQSRAAPVLFRDQPGMKAWLSPAIRRAISAASGACFLEADPAVLDIGPIDGRDRRGVAGRARRIRSHASSRASRPVSCGLDRDRRDRPDIRGSAPGCAARSGSNATRRSPRPAAAPAAADRREGIGGHAPDRRYPRDASVSSSSSRKLGGGSR